MMRPSHPFSLDPRGHRPASIRTRELVALLVSAGCTHAASAQWSVTLLHPPGVTASEAHAVDGAQQGGFVTSASGAGNASLWSGSSASWLNLHPSGADESFIYRVSDGQQVGDTFLNSQRRASLWSGSAGSWIDLSPAGTFRSIALGVWNGQQVGNARVGLRDHASLWTGTAASWVDLNPTSADSSTAYAIHAGVQVGSAIESGVLHAGLWTGTPMSWTPLHPGIGVATGSEALDVHSGSQVGYVAGVGGHVAHACLWSGSAASFVDLNPAGSTESKALGVWGTIQVGYVRLAAAQSTASLWRGSAASWEDLSLALPGAWSGTIAERVWSDGATIRAVGHGFNLSTLRREGVMWSRPVCYANCDASTASPALTAADFVCFLAKFRAGDSYANCDGSTGSPALTAADFICFLNAFRAGCP